MKQRRKIKRQIVLLSVFFLLVSIVTFTLVFTRAELNPPFIDDFNTNLSGIHNNEVIVDDKVSDYYYLKGLNYTYREDGRVPTGENQNIYPNNRLVNVNITYKGKDINTNKNSYVSISERQDTFIYNKVYPVNNNGTSTLSDDYTLIELIENPFTDRPQDQGFNGWYTDYEGVITSFDSDYYKRYAKIPVTYKNGNPEVINITFNASWVKANVSRYRGGNTTNYFNNLLDRQMVPIITSERVRLPFNMEGYFKSVSIRRGETCNGYYDYYGNYQTNCICNSWSCVYYEKIEQENFVDGNTYYELLNGYMNTVNNYNLPFEYGYRYLNDFNENYKMAGFFRKKTLSYGEIRDGYYSYIGDKLGGTCTNYSCEVYELIQYKKSGNIESINPEETYYYLVTRDTNILVLERDIDSLSNGPNKPLTLTSVYNGNDFGRRLNFSGRALNVNEDINIENVTIYSGYRRQNSDQGPTEYSNTRRVLYGNYHNVRLGRGIKKYYDYLNFVSVLGGSNVSQNSLANYSLIIESGYYQTLSLTNGMVRNSYWGQVNSIVDSKAVYGNDYDRVNKNNNALEVVFCASGSWGGEIYGQNQNIPMFNLTVKSGSFGTNKYDYSAGIYVGGRGYGKQYSPRMIKVEGGYIYNLIGGPLTAENHANINDSFIMMTGGTVESIIGGAGRSATYGNRIIQVTGGTINYHIFGGSNGYVGDESEGTVIGDSFIYVGGNAEVGSQEHIANNDSLYGAEAGSIFGIGNGRKEYATIGSSSNSNIMIKDKALINKNVYGGGNFSAVGISSGRNQTNTNIWVDGGIIKGDLYGGGNNNGAGSDNVKAKIKIQVSSGEIQGSLYGGSNQKGTIYGDTLLNIWGGEFKDSIYGGGRGGYSSSQNPGTYIRDKIDLNIGSDSTYPIVQGNIYGGSAYGSINTKNETSTLSENGVTIVVKNVDLKGSLFGGSKGSSTFTPKVNGSSHITVWGGVIPNIFGGSDLNAISKGDATIILKGGNITNTYGGGNKVGGNNTFITLDGATTNFIFGGSNQRGDIKSSTITLLSGSSQYVFGGNNIGGKTNTTNIIVSGGTLNEIYGGGKLADTNKTNINVNGGSALNIYGGGESASVLESVNINVSSGSVTNLFGGSNQTGNVALSKIKIDEGNIKSVYGGNNAGGKTVNSNIEVNGGKIDDLYGGGKLADTGKTTISLTGSTINNIYGGGEEASVDVSTTLNLKGGKVTSLFGGSNKSGTIPISNITIYEGNITYLYGGNNLGGETKTSNIIINGGILNTVYGGGNKALTDKTNITVNKTSGKITALYGGGNEASALETNILVNGGDIQDVYGGSNKAGDVNKASIEVKNNSQIGDLYGGNNQGGETKSVLIKTLGGNFNNIYGGGKEATSGKTELYIKQANVSSEIYGGGKDGSLRESSFVKITDSNINQSVYAGGKGKTATVLGNTTLKIEGLTTIKKHVFGGGNAALTGSEVANNSKSLVEIAGASIGGNLYGGANTSVLYGTTEVNIGNINGLDNKKITINGTVFGGGEANASGSEVYDFSFISVTKGIKINIINTTSNDIEIKGSIFGSGNASSTSGDSFIYIKDYGKESKHQKNISIQRATKVTLDNSHIELFGATDRTNEYSSVLFSLSRIDELVLSNNSVIYLENGTNLVKAFASIVDNTNKEKAKVTIKNGNVTKNVNNRLYAKEGVNINIATNEAVTAYGKVSGMTFFGTYLRSGDGELKTAFYDNHYQNGDTVRPGEFYSFSSGSYVLGRHEVNHDIEVDGFYSNFENKNQEGVIEVKYIEPIPQDSNYYMWVVGEMISSYDVDLIASRLSTLGTYELPLINSPDPNTVFSIVGVNYLGLPDNFSLVKKEDIPRISVDNTADTKMALTMKTSKTGWITNGFTEFIKATNGISGTSEYLSENSNQVPSLLFNLYHSKNLESTGEIGTVVINLIAIKPIDDLNSEVMRVNINVKLKKESYKADEYEGSMTSGEEHEIFVSTQTNITDKSKLSAYYSLFIENTNNIYKAGYHRSLVSSFVFPSKTKITMIDLENQTPVYYYYIVSDQDVIDKTEEFNRDHEASYDLSKFVKMGSTSLNNNFNDQERNNHYYNSSLRVASEEFIFIVDYEEANINEDKLSNLLLLELRDSEGETIKGVLGIDYGNLTYNIYNNKDALIRLDANLSKANIYLKEIADINLLTHFEQPIVNGTNIQDTTYYNKKLGIVISIYDSNNNLLNGSSLLGVKFTLNNVDYYPRMDGTTRINISPRVANVSSKIKLDTTNSNLSSGTYKIKIETFGSSDGIYYGLVSSDSKELTLHLLNNIYGLKVSLPDNEVTIDKKTGKTMNDNNVLVFNVNYESGLENPNLRVNLKRRKYDQIYSLEYETVDFSDYFNHSYRLVNSDKKEYLITNNILDSQSYYMYLKDNLKSGTYKVNFLLYDGENYIGEVYNYIVIR